MSDLFKDNIKKSQYSALINKLRKAVEEGEETLKLLLFGMFEYSRAVTPPVRQDGNRLSRLAETACASLLA